MVKVHNPMIFQCLFFIVLKFTYIWMHIPN
jgi:hypothetical protein